MIQLTPGWSWLPVCHSLTPHLFQLARRASLLEWLPWTWTFSTLARPHWWIYTKLTWMKGRRDDQEPEMVSRSSLDWPATLVTLKIIDDTECGHCTTRLQLGGPGQECVSWVGPDNTSSLLLLYQEKLITPPPGLIVSALKTFSMISGEISSLNFSTVTVHCPKIPAQLLHYFLRRNFILT